MSHRLRIVGSTVLLAVPIILLAVGCGAGAGPSDTASATARGTRPSASTPTTTVSTGPAAPATPSAQAKAPLTAADGRNLAACADGKCEVVVRTGDSLPNASGVGPVTILVGDGEVTISQTSASGFSSTLSGRVGNTEQLNNQVFLILATQGARAVLRLSRR